MNMQPVFLRQKADTTYWVRVWYQALKASVYCALALPVAALFILVEVAIKVWP